MLYERELLTAWQPDALGSLLLQQAQRRHLSLDSEHLKADLANISPPYALQLVQQRSQTANNSGAFLTRFAARSAADIDTNGTQDASNLQWKLLVAADGQQLAVLQDDALEIHRLPQGQKHHSHRNVDIEKILKDGNQAHMKGATTSLIMSLPLRFDPEPEDRVLAWSPDQRFIAVAFSDGKIEIFSLEEGRCVYCIQSSDKKLTRTALTINKEINLLRKARPKYRYLAFIDPEKNGRSRFENGRYDYQLVCVSMDCNLTSYLFTPVPYTDSDTEGEDDLEIEDTEGLSIYREQLVRGGPITFSHSFDFGVFFQRIQFVKYLWAENVLLIGGQLQKEFKDDVGPLWILKPIPADPHFHAIDKDVQHCLNSVLNNRRPRHGQQSWFSWLYPATARSLEDSSTLCSCHVSPDKSCLLIQTASGVITIWTLDLQKRFDSSLDRQTDRFPSDMFTRAMKSDDESKYALRQVFWWFETSLLVISTSAEIHFFDIQDGKLTPKLTAPEKAPLKSSCICRPGESIFLDCEERFIRLRVRKDGHFTLRYFDTLEEIAQAKDKEENSKSISTASWLQTVTGVALKPIRLLTDVFLWNFDKEPQTMFKDCTVVERTFKLLLMHETDAYELYIHRIRAGQFEDALALAQEHNLDQDLVHKARWLMLSSVTHNDVADILGFITDRTWVLKMCCERTGATIQAEQALLQHGLKLTDSARSVLGQSTTKIADETKALLLYRYRLLRLMDRLRTFETIYTIAEDDLDFGRLFKEFQRLSIREVAIRFVKFGSWPFTEHALLTLFTR